MATWATSWRPTSNILGRSVSTARRCKSAARPNDRRANTILCGSLVNIAAVYKSQHAYHRAAEYCAQALEVRQGMPSKDPLALIGLHTALATLQLADDRVKPDGKGDSAELAEAEKNIAAARRLCEEHGLLDVPAGIGVLELEAIVDVRRDKPDDARKSLDAALSLAPVATRCARDKDSDGAG